MGTAEWILTALAATLLWLDLFAIRKLFTSSFFEPRQRWVQLGLIIFLPMVGAWLTLYFCRENVAMFQHPPVDHVRDIDPMTVDIPDGGLWN
jgi:hypothetical protein